MQNPPLPAFAAFYRAINGRDPFPWQARLAEYVAKNERWPAEIGVPTGLGKTPIGDQIFPEAGFRGSAGPSAPAGSTPPLAAGA